MSMWVEIIFKVTFFLSEDPKMFIKTLEKKLGQKVTNLATPFENLSN